MDGDRRRSGEGWVAGWGGDQRRGGRSSRRSWRRGDRSSFRRPWAGSARPGRRAVRRIGADERRECFGGRFGERGCEPDGIDHADRGADWGAVRNASWDADWDAIRGTRLRRDGRFGSGSGGGGTRPCERIGTVDAGRVARSGGGTAGRRNVCAEECAGTARGGTGVRETGFRTTGSGKSGCGRRGNRAAGRYWSSCKPGGVRHGDWRECGRGSRRGWNSGGESVWKAQAVSLEMGPRGLPRPLLRVPLPVRGTGRRRQARRRFMP